MKIEWVDGFTIKVRVDGGDTVVISANPAGLRSLAMQLMALADEPYGSHIHYDAYSSLEEGSVQMIVENTEG